MIARTKLFLADCDGVDMLDAYTSTKGLFFIYFRSRGYISEPYQCREVFGDEWSDDPSDRYIGFSAVDLDIKRLNRFFGIIPKALGTKAIVIYRTDIKNTVVLSVPSWWRASALRREFFTLFLRCGALYYETSFKAAIKAYNLTSQITQTVDRFLAGHTKFNGNEWDMLDEGGVVDFFAYKSIAQMKECLIK